MLSSTSDVHLTLRSLIAQKTKPVKESATMPESTPPPSSKRYHYFKIFYALFLLASYSVRMDEWGDLWFFALTTAFWVFVWDIRRYVLWERASKQH
jgi:hypothetical protein